MIRRPPRSTRTDTLFPYTTLFRSLTIDLLPFVKGTSERLDDLAAAREIVWTSDDFLGGTPVIRGTRVPVYDVSADVVAGRPIQRILDAWQSIDAEKVSLAAFYAEAKPPRGRPQRYGDPSEGGSTGECGVREECLWT